MTNLQVELQTHLSDERDAALRQALEDHLKNVFSPFAHDIDLSFYAVDDEGRRLEHRSAVMEAEQETYVIELPAADYFHSALANVASEPLVQLLDDELRDESRLSQKAGSPAASHTAGLFSARLPLTVHRDENEKYDVNLYMVNSAGALIVHRDSCDYVSATCELMGLADGFTVCDSSFTYSPDMLVEADFVDAEPYLNPAPTKAGEADTTAVPHWRVTPAIFCGVGFPSRDAVAKSDGDIWQFALNVLLKDGTVTRSVISMATPLPAGGLRLLRGWLHGDGSFEPEPVPDVIISGISITLDWKEGMIYNPVLE